MKNLPCMLHHSNNVLHSHLHLEEDNINIVMVIQLDITITSSEIKFALKLSTYLGFFY